MFERLKERPRNTKHLKVEIVFFLGGGIWTGEMEMVFAFFF